MEAVINLLGDLGKDSFWCVTHNGPSYLSMRVPTITTPLLEHWLLVSVHYCHVFMMATI